MSLASRWGRPSASAACVIAALVAASSAQSVPPPHATSEVILGNVRVQALSPTLLRIEPRGPRGFENQTTFMVRNRDFVGTKIWKDSESSKGILLRSSKFRVLLQGTGAPPPSCVAPATKTDVIGPKRSFAYPHGVRVKDLSQCCLRCEQDATCMAWVFASPALPPLPGVSNCWPLASFTSTTTNSGQADNREVGCSSRGCSVMARPAFVVQSNEGTVLYNSSADANDAPNLLHWPSPLHSESYALIDFPRFFVPDWALTPIPHDAKVDPDLVKTNGYDFRNNINGDTYVFLLGDSLVSWQASRKEFLQLTGPCPLLPDFAFGTWFTRWAQYSQKEAKDEIEHWDSSKLPLDVWGLDMNWRLPLPPLDVLPVKIGPIFREDEFYDYPNPSIINESQAATDWFGYLQKKKLRTYFNDHPFPVSARGEGGLQTSKEEIDFRWKGLSKWMKLGLTYWWYDHNWVFSIPPPFVNAGNASMIGLLPPDWQTDYVWQGLDNVAWGSHLYYSTVETFDRTIRDKAGDDYGGRPISLTKSFVKDWRPGRDAREQAEHPSHHRYPVWWTGDGVNLQASVESMVDAGVHSLKPYVHSDCGGDYTGIAGHFDKGSPEDLLRWTGSCVFGPILRFHGGDHRPWAHNDSHIEGVIRQYLNMRYKMIPSLIAAGQQATQTGFPLVARGDLYWPEHAPDSASNHQYVFLEDMLVAPLWDVGKKNTTSRTVWIPPGSWEDAWDGTVVKGPKEVKTSQPAERIPLWYRRDGGLLVLASDEATRVDDQDWSELTIEAWPSELAQTTRRAVFERGSSASTSVTLDSTVNGSTIRIGALPAGSATERWVVRFHLLPGWILTRALVDGEPAVANILQPPSHFQHAAATHFPLGGTGTAPAQFAGMLVELKLSPSPGERTAEIVVSSDKELVV